MTRHGQRLARGVPRCNGFESALELCFGITAVQLADFGSDTHVVAFDPRYVERAPGPSSPEPPPGIAITSGTRSWGGRRLMTFAVRRTS